MIVPVAYKSEWDDGFGARGWKLDTGAQDPEIIASTSFPGANISTSVLIHDVLDHFVSGFGLSGHRNEAMALMQLHLRTGSDIRPDIEQMIEEDVLHGRVIGEPLDTFLPNDLLGHLPTASASDKQKMAILAAKLGQHTVRTRLRNHFLELGTLGISRAKENWKRLGLDYSMRAAIGLCLQSLLENADKYVCEQGLNGAGGDFIITNAACALWLYSPHDMHITLPVLRCVDEGAAEGADRCGT